MRCSTLALRLDSFVSLLCEASNLRPRPETRCAADLAAHTSVGEGAG